MKSKALLTLIVVAVIIISAPAVRAQVPPLISYQGLLLDGNGDPVTTPVNVDFNIWDDETVGNPVWNEMQMVAPDAEGRFNVLLGQNNPLADDVFNEPDRWLGVQVEGDDELVPRIQIVSVAYAFRIETVDGATGGTIDGDIFFQENNDALIGFNYPDDDFNRRLRITAGREDNQNNDQGACIDLHGIDNTRIGDLDLVAGSGGWINFFTSVIGTDAQHRMVINTVGNVGIGIAEPNAALQVNGAISRQGTLLLGDNANTHVNLGTNSTTGLEGENIRDATIGGGLNNMASDRASTVSGGEGNTASGWLSTISGGFGNTATRFLTTVGGGRENQAIVTGATIGGGLLNVASNTESTVSGGNRNTASGQRSTVAGGQQNTASGQFSTVGGGFNNTASATCAVIPGGCGSLASGDYSFAAGSGAKAIHNGAFVWADAASDALESTADNQIMMLGSGGTWIYSDPDLLSGVTIHPGASAWATYSDRSLKENLTPVDSKEILQKISSLPINEWNFRAQSDNVKHIGPTAQDFYSVFGLGDDDKTISTIDPSGVAMAGIQGLLDKIEQLEARIAELEAERR